jgi:hypothetical protein
MPKIVQDRLSDFLWEWQSCLASTFARHDKRSFLPKQIVSFFAIREIKEGQAEEAFRGQMSMREPCEYGSDEVPIPVRETGCGNSHS